VGGQGGDPLTSWGKKLDGKMNGEHPTSGKTEKDFVPSSPGEGDDGEDTEELRGEGRGGVKI